jgi:uncharacterized protein YcbK (DUF882 family)
VAIVIDWEKIKYFSKNENWGDPNKVDAYLVQALDALRGMVNKPIVIHCAYDESGHATNSQHYKGKAADIHIVGMDAVDQLLAAEKIGLFNGIGIYPFWNNPGLHVDVRTVPARWARDKKGNYVSLNWDFLKSLK